MSDKQDVRAEALKACPLCGHGAYLRRDRMAACSLASCPLGDERTRITVVAWQDLPRDGRRNFDALPYFAGMVDLGAGRTHG